MHIYNTINSKIKDKSKITYSTTTTVTTRLLLLVTIIVAVAGIGIALASVPVYLLQSVEATTSEGFSSQDIGLATEEGFAQSDTGSLAQPKAPMAVSQDGNNVYIVWWTNKSENWEVMFRASNDGGQTFGDKINLSNSTDAESQNAEIVAAGNNRVLVSWWETNPVTGSSESVLRISNDAGQTFGPMIMLGMNGTISDTTTTTTAVSNTTETMTTNTTAEGGGGAGAESLEEEAVGGPEAAE
jgi:hypothetical protein